MFHSSRHIGCDKVDKHHRDTCSYYQGAGPVHARGEYTSAYADHTSSKSHSEYKSSSHSSTKHKTTSEHTSTKSKYTPTYSKSTPAYSESTPYWSEYAPSASYERRGEYKPPPYTSTYVGFESSSSSSSSYPAYGSSSTYHAHESPSSTYSGHKSSSTPYPEYDSSSIHSKHTKTKSYGHDDYKPTYDRIRHTNLLRILPPTRSTTLQSTLPSTHHRRLTLQYTAHLHTRPRIHHLYQSTARLITLLHTCRRILHLHLTLQCICRHTHRHPTCPRTPLPHRQRMLRLRHTVPNTHPRHRTHPSTPHPTPRPSTSRRTVRLRHQRTLRQVTRRLTQSTSPQLRPTLVIPPSRLRSHMRRHTPSTPHLSSPRRHPYATLPSLSALIAMSIQKLAL
jgi:hypothetical protein